MNGDKKKSALIQLVRECVIGGALLVASITQASTVWTGSPITFTQTSGSDPSQEANQDRITPNVWITRAGTQGIYNAKLEAGFSHS
ncbi:MAG: hypothetical protein ABIQ35_10720 [Verrucomicrobiota bacterium]